MSKHSNVKPPEPEKLIVDVEIPQPPPPVRAPVDTTAERMAERPDVNGPLLKIVPIVAPALKQTIDNLQPTNTKDAIISRFFI